MDIYCPRCGEPWDAYGARQALDMTREEYNSMMEGTGCPCCAGKEVEKRPVRAEMSAIARDLSGDDVDGMAADLEDMEFLMGSEFWD